MIKRFQIKISGEFVITEENQDGEWIHIDDYRELREKLLPAIEGFIIAHDMNTTSEEENEIKENLLKNSLPEIRSILSELKIERIEDFNIKDDQ